MSTPTRIPSLVVGGNAELMRAAAAIYVETGDLIVDATYGRGTFWRALPALQIVAHDLTLDGVDMRALPERDRTVDVLVLDPPYRLAETAPMHVPDFEDRYGLDDVAYGGGVGELEALYAAAIGEAARVLTRRGRVLIKCQDLVNGRAFVPMLVRVATMLEAVDLHVIDVLVLHAERTGPSGARPSQHHTRRTHSYLVVAARSRYWRPHDARPIPPPDQLTLSV